MKKAFCLLYGIIILVVLCSCQCKHTWVNATCAAPVTCSECGETAGEPLGHVWQAATCATPKTCISCNATDGTTTAHVWQAATCTTPKTCAACQATDGAPTGHVWQAATCTAPQICSVCKTTEGTTADHVWQSATCTTPKTCSVCHATEGTANEHSWQDATCTTPQICSVCHVVAGPSAGHVWQAATCSAPKTCSVCKTIEGTISHQWVPATCTTPKTCSACGKTDGNALGHTTGETCSRCGEYTTIYNYLLCHVLAKNSNSTSISGPCYTVRIADTATWRMSFDYGRQCLVICMSHAYIPTGASETQSQYEYLYISDALAPYFYVYARYSGTSASPHRAYGESYIDPVKYPADPFSFTYYEGDDQERDERRVQILLLLDIMDHILSTEFSSCYSSADLGFSIH